MNFTFSEEQRLLEDTVRKFVARDYNFEKRNSMLLLNKKHGNNRSLSIIG